MRIHALYMRVGWGGMGWDGVVAMLSRRAARDDGSLGVGVLPAFRKGSGMRQAGWEGVGWNRLFWGAYGKLRCGARSGWECTWARPSKILQYMSEGGEFGDGYWGGIGQYELAV